MGTRNPVKVFSDHSNLLYFKTAKYLSPKQAQWASFLDNFNMLIYHVSGKNNPADGPSQREDYVGNQDPQPSSHVISDKIVSSDTISLNNHDLYFQKPSQLLLDHFDKHYLDSDKKEGKHLKNENTWWYQDRILVPSLLRTKLLKFYHDSTAVGHPGIARTLSTLQQTFSWLNAKKTVIDYVKLCDSCQRVKAKRQGPQGPLILIVPDSKPWSTIGMDMITKLPSSNGFDLILVVIDLLSKLTLFIPYKEASSSEVLANIFRQNIFQLHGIPDKIVSYRGSTFVSKFWKSFMNSLNIKAAFSTAYHPQTDGQTERMNQLLEDYLRHFCSYYQDNWDCCLDMAEFSINNLNSASLGVSPFFFTYGHHPKFNMITETSGQKDLDDFIVDLQETQEVAIKCLTQARIQQANYYNKGRRELPCYEKDDQIMILRKFIVSRRINNKLDYRWIGPFRVEKMVGANAVKVDIKRKYPKLHPVFNVSLLTRYIHPDSIVDRGLNTGIKEQYYDKGSIVDWSKLKAILDVRAKKKGRFEYLISWQNSIAGEDTWIADQHMPVGLRSYLEQFCLTHEKEYKKKKKGKTKEEGFQV
jgi:hypothetical protein